MTYADVRYVDQVQSPPFRPNAQFPVFSGRCTKSSVKTSNPLKVVPGNDHVVRSEKQIGAACEMNVQVVDEGLTGFGIQVVLQTIDDLASNQCAGLGM